MQHTVPANAPAMHFRELECEICQAKNSVGILQRLIEDTMQAHLRFTAEDSSFIHYAAVNALREVQELHDKFYATLEAAA
ncbi:hypothetical protein [Pseudochrobactrum sp. MP213Fo]|uniref:hypothetical protein n=1 Tax=Pseudochrobactrum sp. MP213Fo TaxID=3022250 RepID=UPI003B9E1B83